MPASVRFASIIPDNVPGARALAVHPGPGAGPVWETTNACVVLSLPESAEERTGHQGLGLSRVRLWLPACVEVVFLCQVVGQGGMGIGPRSEIAELAALILCPSAYLVGESGKSGKGFSGFSRWSLTGQEALGKLLCSGGRLIHRVPGR
jgi:hypothetical protein